MKRQIKIQALRMASFILSAVLLLCSFAVQSFAEDNSYTYYYANAEMTEIYITGFRGSVGADGTVIVPDTVADASNLLTVVGIAEYAFRDIPELDTVVVPDTVRYVDENAFFGCGNVELIRKSSYDGGNSDSSEQFDDHQQEYIISGTTLLGYKGDDTSVSIPSNCTAIAAGAFKNNKTITSLYLGREITKIGEGAFEGCENLTEVTAGVGMNAVDMGKNAFKGTRWLKNYPSAFVVLGTTLVKYKGSAESVTIPNVVTAVASGAFELDDVTSAKAFKVTVPVSVEFFGDGCFYLYESATPVYPNICVYENSAAYDYCKKNGLYYTLPTVAGDVDGDLKVTAGDARYVLRVSANLEKPVIDRDFLNVADVTGDNRIAADDARLILRIAANLETVNSEELSSMPKTDYEIMLYVQNAVSLAKSYGCAYSMFAYQSITKSDMNTNTKTYLNMFKNELVGADKAQTVSYGIGDPNGLDKLHDITLIDYEAIEDADCVIENGRYNISLTLKDEEIDLSNPDVDFYTGKMFPVQAPSYFVNKVRSTYWGSNVEGKLTYTGCTLEMIADAETGMITDMVITANYDFEVWGKIMGLKVGGKNGNATATRTDVIRYNNFRYFDI